MSHAPLLSIDAHILNARNNFYPGWWTIPESDTGPLYRVVCSGVAECTLAREARPEGVRATFKLSAAKQQRLDELMEKNSDGTLSSDEELDELRDLVRTTEELQLANAQHAFEMTKRAA